MFGMCIVKIVFMNSRRTWCLLQFWFFRIWVNDIWCYQILNLVHSDFEIRDLQNNQALNYVLNASNLWSSKALLLWSFWSWYALKLYAQTALNSVTRLWTPGSDELDQDSKDQVYEDSVNQTLTFLLCMLHHLSIQSLWKLKIKSKGFTWEK